MRKPSIRHRSLRLESLETRELLSVSPVMAVEAPYEAASETPVSQGDTMPPAPSDLTATYTGADGFWTFSWTDNDPNSTNIQMELSIDGGETWRVVGIPQDNTMKFYIGLRTEVRIFAAVSYDYFTDTWTGSERSNTVVLQVPDARPPAMPTDLAVAKAADGSYTLTWTDTADNEVTTEVRRSDDVGKTWTTIKTKDQANLEEISVDGTAGSIFQIRYSNSYGSSDWTASVATLPVLPSPTGLQLYNTGTMNGTTNTRELGIVWQAVDGAVGYRVERSPDGQGDWSVIFEGVDEDNNIFDADIQPKTTYYYRVTALAAPGSGMEDSEPTVNYLTTVNYATYPEDCLKLQLTDLTDTTADLSWQAYENSTKYAIELAYTKPGTIGDVYEIVAVTNETSYHLTGLIKGVNYTFRLFAYTDEGEPLGCNGDDQVAFQVVRGTTWEPLPATPTGLKAVAKDSETVVVSWNPVNGAYGGYAIEQSLTGEDGTWEDADCWSTESDTKVEVWYLESGTKYYFRVRAFNNSGGESAFSDAVVVMTPTAIPGEWPDLYYAEARSDKTVLLKWTAAEGATSYIVERFTDGSTWKKVATVKNATEYLDKNLAAGTVYYYRVSAANAGGATEPGGEMEVQTHLSTAVAATVKVNSKLIGTTSVEGLTITPNRKAPDGLCYYIEYTSTVDAKKKADWSRSTVEKVEGTTHDLASVLQPGTQYFVRVVATYVDFDPAEGRVDWDDLDSVALSREVKFKTKSFATTAIAATGYTITADGQLGARLRIRLPSGSTIPEGCEVTYQLVAAGDKAKVDRSTGILQGSVNLGEITFTGSGTVQKPTADSEVISFSDLAQVGDLTSMKNVQLQLLVVYTLPGAEEPLVTVATKTSKLAMPKWL